MKQLFLMVNDGSVAIIDAPAPTSKENYVVVETEYSIVSAGTERGLASFGGQNLIQKALSRPDQLKKVTEKISTDGLLTTIESAFNKLKDPMPMGYSGVGIVRSIGKGVGGVEVGDRVAMVGTAYHAEVNRVNKNMIAKIPAGDVDYKQYSMAALGGIALQGIHQAKVVPGETVAVIGLGLLGHICARILNAYGCNVIAFDVVDKSLPNTRLQAFINSNDDSAADTAKALTHGRGVDKVIITAAANTNAPMDLAAAITRDRGIICMIGVTQMNIDRRPYYERELTFTIARSYGPGRYNPDYEEKGVDIPIGYVRFTEGRNVEEFVRLVSEKRVNFSDLITHVIPFEEAPRAYEMITTNKNNERYIGILLEYTKNESKWNSTIVLSSKKEAKNNGKINVGMVGAGNFARTTILPNMLKNGHFVLKTLATTGGINAAQAVHNFKFEKITNDYKEMLGDPEIDLVVISTNHNSHGKFVVEALKAGKNVYVEKPLCLTIEELDAIEEAYRESGKELFCGMNRRHAPLIKTIKKKLSTDKIPAMYDYIVNAGFIPSSHWTQDEKVGGGRIIGEACHFVDTIQFLDGSNLLDISLVYADNAGYPCKDNALLTLKFESGAVANILYTSMGSKKYPKEELRVFSNGSIYCLNNYVGLQQYGSVKKNKTKLKQDKGIENEYSFIVDVLNGKIKNSTTKDAFSNHRLLIEAIGKKK